tara:strand:- start:196 stop:378 length:183 start_codon:yes stop_codon:yes gene_type:complete
MDLHHHRKYPMMTQLWRARGLGGLLLFFFFKLILLFEFSILSIDFSFSCSQEGFEDGGLG